jgi:NADH-quinone oxidoreductase subunit L
MLDCFHVLQRAVLQAMEPEHVERSSHRVVSPRSQRSSIGIGGAAIYLYRGKDSDPVRIKLFANKFYFDEIYAVIVRVFQDRLAWIVTGIERIFVDGIVARLPDGDHGANRSSHAACCKAVICKAYTFLLGGGVIAVIYLVVFVLPRLGH